MKRRNAIHIQCVKSLQNKRKFKSLSKHRGDREDEESDMKNKRLTKDFKI